MILRRRQNKTEDRIGDKTVTWKKKKVTVYWLNVTGVHAYGLSKMKTIIFFWLFYYRFLLILTYRSNTKKPIRWSPRRVFKIQYEITHGLKGLRVSGNRIYDGYVKITKYPVINVRFFRRRRILGENEPGVPKTTELPIRSVKILRVNAIKENKAKYTRDPKNELLDLRTGEYVFGTKRL